MWKMQLDDQVVTISKRVHDGNDIFQVEWPDSSLDFLYVQEDNDHRKSWKSLTELAGNALHKIGRYIQKQTKQLIQMDYTNEGFTMIIEKEKMKGYASIHSILYREEDGLDVTGNYFVYLLHPVMGSTNFTLERTGNDESPWNRSGGAFWIDDETVKTITDEIEIRRMKEELGFPSTDDTQQ